MEQGIRSISSEKDLERKRVQKAYEAAEADNEAEYARGNPYATEKYVFPNQTLDAKNIVEMFRDPNIRVVSVIKRTKVGADGLMIEFAYLMCTDPDDHFVIHPKKIFFMTGMSNKNWQDQMKSKMPQCFKENIFHHGQIQKMDMRDLRDILFIWDENDVADKTGQKIHNIFTKSGILDINQMISRNIRFLFISATNKEELRALYQWRSIHQWGDRYKSYKLTIPSSYIGHYDFLNLGIIQEFYPIKKKEDVERWIQEDIIDHYGMEDPRIHFIRTTKKMIDIIEATAKEYDIKPCNHFAEDKMVWEKVIDFVDTGKHVIVMCKNLLKRADFIPNSYKMKVGAMTDQWSKNPRSNLGQEFTGRKSGYWRDQVIEEKEELENGVPKKVVNIIHKTGPYRTSISVIKEYEEFYDNPELAIQNEEDPSGDSNLIFHPKNLKGSNYAEKKKKKKTSQIVKHPELFTNHKDVKEFLTNVLGYACQLKPFSKFGDVKNKEEPEKGYLDPKNGYEVSTRLNFYYKKKMNELTSSDRIIGDQHKEISGGIYKNQPYLVVPVYENKDSKPDEVKYYVQYRQENTDSSSGTESDTSESSNPSDSSEEEKNISKRNSSKKEIKDSDIKKPTRKSKPKQPSSESQDSTSDTSLSEDPRPKRKSSRKSRTSFVKPSKQEITDSDCSPSPSPVKSSKQEILDSDIELLRNFNYRKSEDDDIRELLRKFGENDSGDGDEIVEKIIHLKRKYSK
jgi:hypothetical protein